MLKGELVQSAAAGLYDAGFRLVECIGSRSSFDIIARRDDVILLVKALANVEGLCRNRASELKQMAHLIGGIPIVMSERMKNSFLADGTVYDRYGVVVCNVPTLFEIVNDEAPRAYARRGSYCVHVDGGMLSLARKRRGMTQESLAKTLGVSKQSVYRYESSSSVSLEIFDRMVEIFGDEFIKSEFKLTYDTPNPKKREAKDSLPRIKSETRQGFESMGFKISITNAPFDMVASKKKTVFSVVSNDWRRLESKLETLSSVTDLLEGYTMCVTERKVKSDLPHLTPLELAELGSAKELFKFLSQK